METISLRSTAKKKSAVPKMHEAFLLRVERTDSVSEGGRRNLMDDTAWFPSTGVWK
jgi:hypothetical protein